MLQLGRLRLTVLLVELCLSRLGLLPLLRLKDPALESSSRLRATTVRGEEGQRDLRSALRKG
jgi:hypothetical protein